jgi:hypothetical protein
MTISGPSDSGQPPPDRLGHATRREILALGIDRAPRGGDLVDIELLDLADLGALRHLRTRPGNADVDFAEHGGQRFGPAITRFRHRREWPSARAKPPLPGQVSERRGNRSL